MPPGSGLPAPPPSGTNAQGATPNTPQSTPLPPETTVAPEATPPETTVPPNQPKP